VSTTRRPQAVVIEVVAGVLLLLCGRLVASSSYLLLVAVVVAVSLFIERGAANEELFLLFIKVVAEYRSIQTCRNNCVSTTNSRSRYDGVVSWLLLIAI
jgi:hypothetical protein